MRRRGVIVALAIWLSLGALFVYAAGWMGLVRFLIFGAFIPIVFRYLYFPTVYRGLLSPRTAVIVSLELSIPAAAVAPMIALIHGADATREPHWWMHLVALVLGAGGTLAAMISTHPPPGTATPPTPRLRDS